MKTFVVLAAAMGLAGAGLSPAWAASAPDRTITAAQTPEEAALLQKWLADIAVWGQGYETLTTAQGETLGLLLDGAEQLLGKLNSGGTRAATPWAQTWAGQMRARQAASIEQYKALSPKAPAYPAGLPTTPEMRRRIAVLGQTSDQVGTLMLAMDQAGSRYIDAIQKAASGRDEDLMAVDNARLGLLTAQLEAEITLLTTSGVGANAMNREFANAQIAGNRAMIQYLDRNRLHFAGQPVDHGAAAARMRAEAVKIRSAAEGMIAAVADTRRDLADNTELQGTSLGALFEQIFVSFLQSAAVEQQVADAVDVLAASVQTVDEDSDVAAAEAIGVVIERRVALDQQRRQLLMAAGGG